MTNNQLTDNQLTKIIESAEAVISALAGTNEDVHPDNSTQMCRLWDTLNDNDATPEVVLAMARELQEHRKAAESELKLANLINKFYERYPIASFKSDNERAAALGYFMAGAELQCFGEFVKYEELCGDE